MSYYPIIDKLSTQTASDTIWQIISHYHQYGSTVVNYLYGANIIKYQLLEDQQNTYKQALLDGDFLLPDGIALRTLRVLWRQAGIINGPSTISNLNGTDMIDKILTHLTAQGYHIHLSLYCNYDPKLRIQAGELIAGAKTYLATHYNISIDYAVDKLYGGPETRDRTQYAQTKSPQSSHENKQTINIILVCTGTPHQEWRIAQNRSYIKQHHCLVLAQGWTLDFRSGKEPRAPQRLRSLHGEFIYRLIINPRKNRKKCLISLMMIWLIVKEPCKDFFSSLLTHNKNDNHQ